MTEQCPHQAAPIVNTDRDLRNLRVMCTVGMLPLGRLLQLANTEHIILRRLAIPFQEPKHPHRYQKLSRRGP